MRSNDSDERGSRTKRYGYKGCDLEAPVHWPSHLIHEAGRATAELKRLGLPFVLVPIHDPRTGLTVRDFDQDVLVGQQVSPRFVEVLRKPCVRSEEWAPTKNAPFELPPCLRWHAENLERCPDSVVNSCMADAVEAMGLRGPLKSVADRMLADQTRNIGHDMESEFGRVIPTGEDERL